MTVIVPISEMRNTSKMFELSEKQPVYITKNGYGARVLMNIEVYGRIKEILRDVDLEERFEKSEKGGNLEAHEFLKSMIDE